jgi:TonB family protein
MSFCSEKTRFGWLGVMFILLLSLDGRSAGVASEHSELVSFQGSNWERYVVKDEEFSVLLPERPAMAVWPYSPRPLVVRKERTLGAYADGVVYVIYCYENPGRDRDLTYFLEKFKTHHGNGEISFERDLQMPGVEGKQYRLRKGDVPGAARLYLTKNSVYVVEALGAAEDDPNVNRFFASFKLERNPSGNKVSEGPGVQAADEEQQSLPPAEMGSGVSGSSAKKPNSAAAIFRGSEVTRRPVVVMRPKPHYTEEARKHRLSGTVVLKAIFSASGRVTNVRVVSALEHGLTDQAIAAAKQIRFIPAMKDGRFVSMYSQVEYTFTLY